MPQTGTNNRVAVEVQFRKHKGEIFAVFPYEIWDLNGNVVSYSHVGQHSGCSIDFIRESRKADPEEYRELSEELYILGYDLTLIKHRDHSKYLKAYNDALLKYNHG